MDNLEKDLIIIGAGINGLSAGLAYAVNTDLTRKKVLIVEKNPISGGYVTTFTRKGYQFDTCQMISNIADILDYLGLELEMHEYAQDFVRVFKVEPETGKVKTFELHSEGPAFEEQMVRLFPSEASRLQKMFDYSLAMFHEIYSLKYAPGPLDIAKMLVSCPKVLRNMNKTFSQYLKMFGIENPEIDLIFQVFSGMCGLPNDKIAAILTVGVLYSLREKAGRPVGPFIDLPRKMEERYRKLGGEILLRSEVREILIEGRQVRGISLKDGSIIRSRNVISTIDVKVTMQDLIGMERVRSIDSKYAKKVEAARMTTSAFTVNLGIDHASLLNSSRLHCGYALLTSGCRAFGELYSGFENQQSKLGGDSFYIGLSCPATADPEKPVLSIQTIPLPVADWTRLRETDRRRYIQEKEKMADCLIDIVEKYLVPGLRQHITVKDISTPATFARYSGSPTGSIYDMASVPENFGARRLPVVTPIRGLLLPKFAHGVFGAMNSGLQSVDVLLKGKVMQGNSRFKQSAMK